MADVATVAEENIVGVHVVKSFAQEPPEQAKFEVRSQSVFRQSVAGEPAARLLRAADLVHPAARAGRGAPVRRLPGHPRADGDRRLHRLQPAPGDARHAAADARHVDRAGAARDRLRRAHLPGDGRAGGGQGRARTRSTSRPATASSASRTSPSPTSRDGPCSSEIELDRRGTDDRVDRAHRLGQDHACLARPPLLRRDAGRRHDRRSRRARRHARVAAQPDRRHRAGPVPVLGHGPREHRLRRDRSDRRAGRAGGAARAGARVHRQAPGRLRHRHRRARDHALGRTAPADRDRARAHRRPAHPHPRRRHGLGGRDDRGTHPARACAR